MDGFLGTGATFFADLNLILQLAMGATLLLGMMLARSKRFKAHGYCQAAVVLFNLVLIFGIMLPPFRRLSGYYSITFIHGILGSASEMLALYVVLVATRLLPEPLRFSNYKGWMRTALVLWWITIFFGLGTYYMLYLKPERVVPTAVTAATVRVTNFAFEPKELTVPVGTTVEWVDETGQHNVLSDGGSFKSDDLTAGTRFKHQFNEPGTFPYYCEFHGESGGKKMAGVIIVKPK